MQYRWALWNHQFSFYFRTVRGYIPAKLLIGKRRWLRHLITLSSVQDRLVAY